MGYNDLEYQTPSALAGAHPGAKFLIIGAGTSTTKLIPFKDKIRDKFDAVIGLNLTTLGFEDQLDYHLIIEKNPKNMYEPMHNGAHVYRRDLPRILNWKGIHRFPKDFPIYKATRHNFGGKAEIRKYAYSGNEGLLIGPPDTLGLSAGTSAMQALHLACIMGAKEIYLIGADLYFQGEYDHFYPDAKFYRKSKSKRGAASPIVKVQHNGRTYESTEFFRESAKFFDHVIPTYCGKEGIGVYDFSDGLITKAIEIDILTFFEGSG